MSLGKRQMIALWKKGCQIEETLGDKFGKPEVPNVRNDAGDDFGNWRVLYDF